MELLYLLGGLLLGALIAIIVQKQKLRKQDFERDCIIHEQEKEALKWKTRFDDLLAARDGLQEEVDQLRQENGELRIEYETMRVNFQNSEKKFEEQKKELERLQQKFTVEFENIARKILETSSEKISNLNRQNIGAVLDPLKEKLQRFEEKVESTYRQGLKDQTDLRAELKKLYELNARISEEANNLTRALKGDVKKQGNWGEVVLERILERSGLNEGEQGYTLQYSDVTDGGKRVQPDVVINLPDKKHIIVDSKVSLIAYEKAVNAESEAERSRWMKEHLRSLRAHIKGLSEKHYQSATKLNSPDFVLLFIPIEASFSHAVREDLELFSYAWDQKVVLVSPSTLLATLRTIASVWQQENQTRNALEIATQAGALYDKFVGFVADLETIGRNLETTRKNYDAAMNKLSQGSGNLVRRVEKLREMGAKNSKQLPDHLRD